MCKSTNDHRILSVLQKPLEIVSEPFDYYAQKLGISAEQIIILIKNYLSSGIIRRFAGIVKHDKAGYLCNAMVAFEVDENQCDQTGESLSAFSYITHCYRRTSYPDWPYNIYVMMHARNMSDFEKQLTEMKNMIRYKSMAVLPSKREFKKTQFLLIE